MIYEQQFLFRKYILEKLKICISKLSYEIPSIGDYSLIETT